MGYASLHDVWVAPMVREWQTFVPLVFWWIFFHIAAHHLAPRLLPNFRRIKSKDVQQDLVIRIVSSANGLMMSTAMPVFVNNLLQNGISPHNGLYVQLTEYNFYRVAICAYFTWDVITCFYFKWSAAWKIHALCSLLGTYFLLFPMCDDLGSYYGGWFEGTNAFMHVAVILRQLSDVCTPQQPALKSRLDGVATVLEYLFALLFFLIRVCGGSYLTFCCNYRFFLALAHDWQRPAGTPAVEAHDEVVILLSALSISTIQLLQYIWFVAIVKKGLGMDVDDGARKDHDDDKKKKK